MNGPLPFLPADLNTLPHVHDPVTKLSEDLTDLLDDLNVRLTWQAGLPSNGKTRPETEVRYDQGSGLAYLLLKNGQLLSNLTAELPEHTRQGTPKLNIITHAPGRTPGEVIVWQPAAPQHVPVRPHVRLVLPGDLNVLLERFLRDCTHTTVPLHGRLTFRRSLKRKASTTGIWLEVTSLGHAEVHLQDLNTARGLTLNRLQTITLSRACHLAAREYLRNLPDHH